MTRHVVRPLVLTVILAVGCGGEEPLSADGERQGQANLLPTLPAGADELAPPAPNLTVLDLVRHHSPIFYQDTEKMSWPGKEYARNFITKLNWAGSYTPEQNYDAVGVQPMTPHVYYSFSQTQTHYFIGYFVYHFYRSKSGPYLHRFNGATLAVARQGASYGQGVCGEPRGCLVAVITRGGRAYNDLSYGYGLTNGSGAVDGPLSTTGAGFNGDGAQGRHPRLFISTGGSFVRSCEDSAASCGGNHADGIVYYLRESGAPSAAPDPTTGGAGSYTKRYAYGLIALDATSGDRGPWALRNYRNDSETSSCAPSESCTFASWGKLAGDHGELLPWAWDNPSDGPSFAGDLLCDPVKHFDVRLDGAPFENGRLSHRYVSHPYWTHRVKLGRIRPTTSSYSFLVDVLVTASNTPSGTDHVFDASHWRNRTYPLQDNLPSYGGGSDPVDDDLSYGDSSNEHYLCRPSREGGAETAIRIHGKANGDPIWYFGAWLGTPGLTIVKTNHYTCQSYGCAWVDFELESNPNNNFLESL